MATPLNPQSHPVAGDDRLFLVTAICMALIVATGFSIQLAMGRSTSASPRLTHSHAIVFMGWVTIDVAQTAFATTGSLPLHRRLHYCGMSLLLGWRSAA